MRSNQYRAVPRNRSLTSLARCTRRGSSAPRSGASDSQVTTKPGSGSRRQTSSDGPTISISANTTPRDLTRRTYYPLHGDGNG
jgi:hypothetical protein